MPQTHIQHSLSPEAAKPGAAHLRTVEPSGPFKLAPLPYAENALAPAISADTLATHHGKHHATYVSTLNKLVQDQPQLAGLDLAAVVKATAGDDSLKAVFNNAGQAWNHDFYWNSMKPQGGGSPTGKLKAAIESDLGGLADFKKKFHEAAIKQFGSGWVWLVRDDGKLRILQTANAATPMAAGKTCLLTIDVWEHAYYLDYKNKRADYVTSWLDKLVNWEFAERNFG